MFRKKTPRLGVRRVRCTQKAQRDRADKIAREVKVVRGCYIKVCRKVVIKYCKECVLQTIKLGG